MRWNRVGSNVGRWGLRVAVNWLRLSLWASVAGYLVFIVLLLRLMVTNNQPPTTPAGVVVVALARGFNVMLASVTGGGDLEGGFAVVGNVVMAFLRPYLFWGSLGLSMVETVLGRPVLRLSCSLRHQLQGVMVLAVVAMGIAIFQSVVPPDELPYGIRLAVLTLLFAGLAGQLMLVQWLSRGCEQLIERLLAS